MLGVGMVLLASPFLLRRWIHGSYERYVRIISGPIPYDNLGGGPFQLMVYFGLFTAGLALTPIALILRSAVENDV
jgi:hypothetical protein